MIQKSCFFSIIFGAFVTNKADYSIKVLILRDQKTKLMRISKRNQEAKLEIVDLFRIFNSFSILLNHLVVKQFFLVSFFSTGIQCRIVRPLVNMLIVPFNLCLSLQIINYTVNCFYFLVHIL